MIIQGVTITGLPATAQPPPAALTASPPDPPEPADSTRLCAPQKAEKPEKAAPSPSAPAASASAAPPALLQSEEGAIQDPSAPEDWSRRLRQAERREILPRLVELGQRHRASQLSEEEAAPLVAWSQSDDPLVARAANFALGRPETSCPDPLARLYLPFAPGDESAALFKDEPLHEFLAGLSKADRAALAGEELPDTRGRMVSLSTALVDRLVHDPDPNSERTALLKGMSSWNGLETYYSLIRPEPALVAALLQAAEAAYARAGHSQAMDKVDRTRLSVLISLPLEAPDKQKLVDLLTNERFQERNYLGNEVDKLVREPQRDALLTRLAGAEGPMAERLAIGRDLFGLGINMRGPFQDVQGGAEDALVRSLSTLSPHALQVRVSELEPVVRENLEQLKGRLPVTDDLTPLYELAALLRCPGVRGPDLLDKLHEVGTAAFSSRSRQAAGWLALACVEQEGARLQSLGRHEQRSVVARLLESSQGLELDDQMADAAMMAWQKAYRPDPEAAVSARALLANLPPSDQLTPEKATEVVEALFEACRDRSMLAQAPDALALLLGKRVAAEFLWDHLGVALLERQLEPFGRADSPPAERSECLPVAVRLSTAGGLSHEPLEQAYRAHAADWERELLDELRTMTRVAQVHPVLTAFVTSPEEAWRQVLDCQQGGTTLETALSAYQISRGEGMADFRYLLDLVGVEKQDQAVELFRQLKGLQDGGMDALAARQQVLAGFGGVPTGPGGAVVEQPGAVQVGSVRLRRRS
ncbi:MAG: hypothetical protein AMXMBFR33_09070 [Candidatus Xenobia bacterium]